MLRCMYICMYVTIHSPGKFSLCLPATILYAVVCISLTRLNRLARLCGMVCRVCARIHLKGAGCSTTIRCTVSSCASIAGAAVVTIEGASYIYFIQ